MPRRMTAVPGVESWHLTGGFGSRQKSGDCDAVDHFLSLLTAAPCDFAGRSRALSSPPEGCRHLQMTAVR